MKRDAEEEAAEADIIQTSRYRSQCLFDFGCGAPAVVRALSFIEQ